VQSLSAGLETALSVCLLAPVDDPQTQRAAAAALARAGATSLRAEATSLAAALGAVAAVGEAVHGGSYACLAEDLL
jgi:hypothetical protein